MALQLARVGGLILGLGIVEHVVNRVPAALAGLEGAHLAPGPAGVNDPAHLSALLKKWMKINDLRLAAVIVIWAALCAYFVIKPDLPAALG